MSLKVNRSLLNKIVFMILLINCVAATAEEWTETSNDNSAQIFLSKEKNSNSDVKKRFKVKSVFKNNRDIMGLQYNSTITLYTVSCELDLVSSKQQFAYNIDELVWTYPVFNKEVKASLEMSGKILDKVCSD